MHDNVLMRAPSAVPPAIHHSATVEALFGTVVAKRSPVQLYHGDQHAAVSSISRNTDATATFVRLVDFVLIL